MNGQLAEWQWFLMREILPRAVTLSFWLVFAAGLFLCVGLWWRTRAVGYLFLAVFFLQPAFGFFVEQVRYQIHKEEYHVIAAEMNRELEAMRERGEPAVIEHPPVVFYLFEALLVVGIALVGRTHLRHAPNPRAFPRILSLGSKPSEIGAGKETRHQWYASAGLFAAAFAGICLSSAGGKWLSAPTLVFGIAMGELLFWAVVVLMALAAWIPLRWTGFRIPAIAVLIMCVLWLPVFILLVGSADFVYRSGMRFVVGELYSGLCLFAPVALIASRGVAKLIAVRSKK